MEKITIVGTGLIGRAWAMVFARVGHPVRMWDSQPDAAAKALATFKHVDALADALRAAFANVRDKVARRELDALLD